MLLFPESGPKKNFRVNVFTKTVTPYLRKILFRNGELNPLRPDGGCPMQSGTMGCQDGLRADADVR
jgi:hypothetical protein